MRNVWIHCPLLTLLTTQNPGTSAASPQNQPISCCPVSVGVCALAAFAFAPTSACAGVSHPFRTGSQGDVDSVILLISAAGRQILLSCSACLLRLGRKMSLLAAYFEMLTRSVRGPTVWISRFSFRWMVTSSAPVLRLSSCDRLLKSSSQREKETPIKALLHC